VRGPVIIDTGPLVALLNRREESHARVRAVLEQLPTPLLTCEPVLTEAMYLLRNVSGGANGVLALVKNRLLRVPLAIEANVLEIERLIIRYSNVPMSLADACVVRMVELMPDASVFTLDSDSVYRAKKARVIQLVDL
jgi:uncharacterized protein